MSDVEFYSSCEPMQAGTTVYENALFCCPSERMIRGNESTELGFTQGKRPIPDCSGHLRHDVQIDKPSWRRQMDYSPALRLLEDPDAARVRVDGDCFFLQNVYTSWNMGHALSCLLFAIRDLRAHARDVHDYQFVVMRDPWLADANVRDVVDLLLPGITVICLNENVVYEFAELTVPVCMYERLPSLEAIPLCQELTRLVMALPAIDAAAPAPDRIVLCKLPTHTFVRPFGIMSDEVRRLLEARGWTVLDPEQQTLFELIRVLQSAKACILGSGAINYVHRRFINPEALLFFLFHGPNTYVVQHRFLGDPNPYAYYADRDDKHPIDVAALCKALRNHYLAPAHAAAAIIINEKKRPIHKEEKQAVVAAAAATTIINEKKRPIHKEEKQAVVAAVATITNKKKSIQTTAKGQDQVKKAKARSPASRYGPGQSSVSVGRRALRRVRAPTQSNNGRPAAV